MTRTPSRAPREDRSPRAHHHAARTTARIGRLATGALAALCLSACATPARQPAPSTAAAILPTAIRPEASSPAASSAPAADGALSPAEIYERVRPSVAYVETPLGSGSAVLIDDQTLVTNDHVVWPFAHVRVVFPDGSAYEAVGVSAEDPMGDLALLDLSRAGAPVRLDAANSSGQATSQAGAPPPRAARIADGSGLSVGATLYLVGYPAETESYPQPSLTRGLLTRLRRWDALGMVFLETDAEIAAGQSGGALVAGDGSVVGISSMFFGDSDLGLACSAPDAVARLRQLRSGAEVPYGVAPRPIPLAGGAREQRTAIASAWEEAVFALNAPLGSTVALSAESQADVALTVIGPYGDVDLQADDHRRGAESGRVWIQDAGPFFIAVAVDRPAPVLVSADGPLAAYADPDDGTQLQLGTPRTGVMDFPGDRDVFYVPLAADSPYEVVVDTISFLADLEADTAGDSLGEPPALSLTWGGSLGMTMRGTVTPSAPGLHALTVSDRDGTAVGGYLVEVVRAEGQP